VVFNALSFMNHTTHTKTEHGFSLVEVFVAIFFILVGVLAVLDLFIPSIRMTSNSQKVVTASFLAQEGIEIVRNMRDNNAVRGADAFTGEDLEDGSSVGVNILSCNGRNVTFDDLDDCPAERVVGYSESSKEFQIGEGNTFRRVVDIEENSDHIVVEVRVYWDSEEEPSECSTGNECATAKTELYRWAESEF
jgi:Tfp pilus assembly protein PilV